MIEIKNLVKEYDLDGNKFRAVNDVSFNVKKGEVYGIIGLSGAGKSTLIRCINRLEEADCGSILFKEHDVLKMKEDDLREYRTEVAMIFQSFNLFNQKSVYKNIAYPMEIRGVSKKEIEKRVTELLEFIELSDKKNEYPANLSGGQKQRVAIARALASNPEVLLSDESTSALDSYNTEVVLDLLKKGTKQFGLSIILITHSMSVAQRICDRVAVMENGKIIEENTTSEIFSNPKNKLTRKLIYGQNAEEAKLQDDLNSNKDYESITLYFNEENSKYPII